MKRNLIMMSASLLLLLNLPGCSDDAPSQRTSGHSDVGDDTTSPDVGGDTTSLDASGDTASPNISECAITDPNDLPSQEQLEESCEDEDATVIFVDPQNGDDTKSGQTPSNAVKSLGVALSKSTDKRVHILAAAGTFEEQVTLKDGVGIFGGYDAEDGWTRNINDVTTTIDPSGNAGIFDAATSDYISVIAQDLQNPTTLDRLTIHGVDAENYGASSYVIWAHNADGLSIQDATIIAGKGRDGVDGTAGEKGEDRSCGATGGEGGRATLAVDLINCGNAVEHAEDGADGLAGTLGSGQASPDDGGTGGSGGAHACPQGGVSACSGVIGEGANGDPGGTGQPGAHGTPGEPFGDINEEGRWRGDMGALATDGENGTGGGGGGAGGTCAYSGALARGDDGGNGGDGGCGGTRGENGQPGGASFGIFASNSDLSMNGLMISQNEGGDGGDGAEGGEGQSATNQGVSVATGRISGGGRGGDGGLGGDGAAGGDGAGGCGGPSIGIAKFASDFEVPQDTDFTTPSDTSKGGEHAYDTINSAQTAPCDGLIENEYEFVN